jgi:hypothetical protein
MAEKKRHCSRLRMPRRFSHHGDRCTLSIMRNRPSNWVITALLILQLAIGLQWQVAQAAAVLPEGQMNGMKAGHCAGHQSNDSSTIPGGAGASTSAPPSHHNPANKHDCCRSLGCQCHYAQTPALPGLLRLSAAYSAFLRLPVFDARLPVARTNELFRPPIA